jgi:hypothetical protein
LPTWAAGWGGPSVGGKDWGDSVGGSGLARRLAALPASDEEGHMMDSGGKGGIPLVVRLKNLVNSLAQKSAGTFTFSRGIRRHRRRLPDSARLARADRPHRPHLGQHLNRPAAPGRRDRQQRPPLRPDADGFTEATAERDLRCAPVVVQQVGGRPAGVDTIQPACRFDARLGGHHAALLAERSACGQRLAHHHGQLQ